MLLRKAFAVCLLSLFATTLVMAGEKESLSVVNFVVLKEFNGKPLRNASVILHPVDKDGKQKPTGAQLKTDANGKTSYPGIPYGKVRVQVIAPGYQTFGEDFDINKGTQQIEIKMKRPQEQYSIYEKKEAKKD
ncbi:MAG TPA: carboxypeptidase-like regulatory domain-containing protein [Terriglobales bacterium]|nr:carboxypeptidase-like regulatory domain-containing protein [Terriglobales bacterium]